MHNVQQLVAPRLKLECYVSQPITWPAQRSRRSGLRYGATVALSEPRFVPAQVGDRASLVAD
jgi:hypothetical protein